MYGLGGHSGPDAVNMVRARGEDYLIRIIRQGAIGMPAFDLARGEPTDLAAYLRFLDGTGTYPPRRRPPPLFGGRP